MIEFSKENKCRCGYDGTGMHRCHAGRNPLCEDEQCTNEAKPRFVATMSSLAGVQWKTGVALACYCESCHKEAFPDS